MGTGVGAGEASSLGVPLHQSEAGEAPSAHAPAIAAAAVAVASHAAPLLTQVVPLLAQGTFEIADGVALHAFDD